MNETDNNNNNMYITYTFIAPSSRLRLRKQNFNVLMQLITVIYVEICLFGKQGWDGTTLHCICML